MERYICEKANFYQLVEVHPDGNIKVIENFRLLTDVFKYQDLYPGIEIRVDEEDVLTAQNMIGDEI